MLRLLMRIVVALTISLVLALWVVQNNSSVQEMVGKKLISHLEKAWGAHLDIGTPKINFFTFSLYFKNGSITPTDHKQYAWQFRQAKVHVSLFKLLFNNEIALSLTFNNIKASTGYHNGDVDLINHICAMFPESAPGATSVSLYSIAINNAEFLVKQEQQAFILRLPGSFYITQTANQKGLHGNIMLANGTILQNNNVLFNNTSGSCSFEKDNKTGNWKFITKAETRSPLLEPEISYDIDSLWENSRGTLTIKDPTKTLCLTSTYTPSQEIEVKGRFPVALINNLMNVTAPRKRLENMQGACTVDLKFFQNEKKLALAGSALFTDLKLASFPVQSVALTLAGGNDNKTYSSINITKTPDTQLSGAFSWDWDKGAGTLTLSNKLPIIPQQKMAIYPDDLMVNITFDTNGACEGTYKCALTNQTTEKKFSYKGALLKKNNQLIAKGATSRGLYELRAQLSPQLCLTTWRYTIKDNPVINLTASPSNNTILQGSIKWSFLKSFLDRSMRKTVFGNNCSFGITLDQHNLENIHGTITLASGRFYIPEFHNLIQKIHFDTSVDYSAKKVVLDNITIGFSRGSVTCPRATVTFDENFTPSLIHMPLQVNNLFVNWKRDFYGFTYGNLLLNKLPDGISMLSGTLMLKKSLLKNVSFSSENSGVFYGSTGTLLPFSLSNIALDIKLITEKPITAQTDSMSAAVSVNLALISAPHKDLYAMPHLIGSITLESGKLKFLHNELSIDYGKIQFLANQMNDPLIDLIAKNRINKYLITLQATGSLQKPTIMLESTPELTEEQIIGLLLSGSENATLQADLPSMLLQNLDFVFIGNKKQTKTTAFFDKITKTFKYVQITPNLTDDPGRGKLKGSISVNVTDQLRARINKDLDFKKDFSAQLEYLLSDDINLKVIRDQRGELGSEIEVRLKL